MKTEVFSGNCSNCSSGHVEGRYLNTSEKPFASWSKEGSFLKLFQKVAEKFLLNSTRQKILLNVQKKQFFFEILKKNGIEVFSGRNVFYSLKTGKKSLGQCSTKFINFWSFFRRKMSKLFFWARKAQIC